MFCESVLQEQSGVISAIRIIDRVVFAFPEGGTLRPKDLTLFVSLKAGAARGSYPLAIDMEKPSTERLAVPLSLSVFLEGEERGVNLMVPITFHLEMAGPLGSLGPRGARNQGFCMQGGVRVAPAGESRRTSPVFAAAR